MDMNVASIDIKCVARFACCAKQTMSNRKTETNKQTNKKNALLSGANNRPCRAIDIHVIIIRFNWISCPRAFSVIQQKKLKAFVSLFRRLIIFHALISDAVKRISHQNNGTTHDVNFDEIFQSLYEHDTSACFLYVYRATLEIAVTIHCMAAALRLRFAKNNLFFFFQRNRSFRVQKMKTNQICFFFR